MWLVRRADDQLYVPIVLKSGSLNLLEPSRPVQAYTGIAILLFLCWYCPKYVCSAQFFVVS